MAESGYSSQTALDMVKGGSIQRYRRFRLGAALFSSFVVANTYTCYIVFKETGVYDFAFGHYLSYLTNCTAFLCMIYGLVSAAPVLFPTLSKVQWDGFFHPRSAVRRTLYAMSLTTSVYVAVVFWGVLGLNNDDYPTWAKVWDMVTNIGAHGGNIVWLALDACVYDRNLARSYTKRMCLPTILFGLWYFAMASGELVMTELAPYFFME
ncbi:hypothetical protein KIPB_005044, partial [Kipferlia bialata]|eukprot:g5044.t1